MADLDIRLETCSVSLGYPVLISTFENQQEQRRLVTEKTLRTFECSTPPLTQTEFATLETFYTGKLGTLTSFTFKHRASGNTYTVRFASDLRRTSAQGLWKVGFTLVQIDQDET